jgi:hypothetical protein
MDLDKGITEELRALATKGAAPSELLGTVGRRLGVQGTNFRLHAIAYFREAFQLSLGDAMRIGAAEVFPDGQASNEEIDREMLPLIQGTAELWRK